MEIIFASIFAFVTTNVDDIFILTLFLSNPRYRLRSVLLGQYLGIMTLIAISVIGSFIEIVIDLQYIGLLGLLPIYIGIKSAANLFKGNKAEDDETSTPLRDGREGSVAEVLFVASVTIANGGDNISIYIPLFATLALGDKMIMVLIFLLMTAVWCWLARYLSNHSFVKRSLEKYAHIVTPFVFILLGIYILYESGTTNLIR